MWPLSVTNKNLSRNSCSVSRILLLWLWYFLTWEVKPKRITLVRCVQVTWLLSKYIPDYSKLIYYKCNKMRATMFGKNKVHIKKNPKQCKLKKTVECKCTAREVICTSLKSQHLHIYLLYPSPFFTLTHAPTTFIVVPLVTVIKKDCINIHHWRCCIIQDF